MPQRVAVQPLLKLSLVSLKDMFNKTEQL